MRRHLCLSALLPLGLAACLDPDPVPESNYGIIGLTTVVTPVDTLLSPEAQFYRTGLLGLPTSRVSSDQCQIAAYPTPSQGTQLPRFLDAGDSVAVSTATTTKFLFPSTGANGESYVLGQTDEFAFQPGERVTITVPGAPGGFTNGTIDVVTAHAFTLGPIAASPPPDSSLKLTWAPRGDDSTKMLISIQYAVPPSFRRTSRSSAPSSTMGPPRFRRSSSPSTGRRRSARGRSRQPAGAYRPGRSLAACFW